MAALEEKKKALGKQILELMPAYLKSYHVEDLVVRRYSRLSIKMTLEEAKALSLSKLEEVIDKEKVKELIQRGRQIPNVSTLEYITVMRSAQPLLAK